MAKYEGSVARAAHIDLQPVDVTSRGAGERQAGGGPAVPACGEAGVGYPTHLPTIMPGPACGTTARSLGVCCECVKADGPEGSTR